MVKICDAIMGSGKTSATIRYINEHPEKRFLYITPYLEEAARIKNGCPGANFIEPSNKIGKFGFSKAEHTLRLVRERRNIASTHRAMMFYTTETVEALKENGYTVIIDESVQVLQKVEDMASVGDVIMAERAGYLRKISGVIDEYELTEEAENYQGGCMDELFRFMKLRNITVCETRDRSVCYLVFPPEMFTSGIDVFVLTYLFPNSSMEKFFHAYGIGYDMIGVSRTQDGGYIFADHVDYIPEYVSRLPDLIQIEESEKLNEIGKHRTALSLNWYNNASAEQCDQLRKNIYNYFRNRTKSEAKDRLCARFKGHWGKIRAKGYWNSDIAFNARATNEYRDRTVLVYPVNIFAGGDVFTFYRTRGEKFCDDWYALSTMVQWIWRSAIRDGKPIQIYIPSRRMRNLLKSWIADVSKGGDTV